MADTLIFEDDFSVASSNWEFQGDVGRNTLSGGRLKFSNRYGYSRWAKDVHAPRTYSEVRFEAWFGSGTDPKYQELAVIFNGGAQGDLKAITDKNGVGVYIPRGGTPSIFVEGVSVHTLTGMPLMGTITAGWQYRFRYENGVVSVKYWTGTTEPTEWNHSVDISGNASPQVTQEGNLHFIVWSGYGNREMETYIDSVQVYAPDVTPEGPPVVDDAVDLDTPNLSTVANDVTVEVTSDNYVSTLFASRTQSGYTTMYSDTPYPAGPAFIDFELPSPEPGYELTNAKLRIYVSLISGPTTVKVSRLNKEWYTGQYPAGWVIGEPFVSVPVSTNGVVEIDVSSLVGTPFYGFRVEGNFNTEGRDTYPIEQRPSLALAYVEQPPGPPVQVDLNTATMSTKTHDAGFQEVRTVVVPAKYDAYRTQGNTAWVNGSDTLSINYNPDTNLSNVIVPQGTAEEKTLINAALAHIDFPLERLVSGIQAMYGRNYIPIRFGELAAGDEGGILRGSFLLADGEILLDLSLQGSLNELTSTVAHEIGHVVDHVYLTHAQRVSIWNALHPSPSEQLPHGTLVVGGQPLSHGHYWSAGPDYKALVEEAYAHNFIRAYSDAQKSSQYVHPVTNETADTIRAIVTPDLPVLRGPFPAKTSAIRLDFGQLPAEAVVGDILSAQLRLNVIWNTGGQYLLSIFEPEGRFGNTAAGPITLDSGTNYVETVGGLDPTMFESIYLHHDEATAQTLTISATEDTAANTEPVFIVRYAVAQGATLVDADTAEATADVAAPVVEATTDPSVRLDVVTVNAVIEASETAAPVIDIETQLENTSTVMFGAYDPEVRIDSSVWIDLDSPRVFMQRIPVTDVNGEPVMPTESEDRYFVSTMETLVGIQRGFSGGLAGLDKDSAIAAQRQVWFRMNEKTGSVAEDRLYARNAAGEKIDNYDLLLNNVVLGRNDGPEGRHHFYFNGDAYAQQDSDRESLGEKEAGIEFTFRTTKKNQFLMGNADSGGTLSVQPANTWELWMVDGRLEIRVWRVRTGYQTETQLPVEIHRGFTDYSDGGWHHVVLQSGYETWVNNRNRTQDTDEWGLELHVDSKLELRRRLPAMGVAGFPDYIGGRPGPFYGDVDYPVRALDVPRSAWFVGDLTEVVYRYGRVLSGDEIAKQRDTMMGIYPFYPDAARVTAKAHNAITRGNKPRLLVLHMGQMGYDYAIVDGKAKYTRSATVPVGSQADFTSDRLFYADDFDNVSTREFPFIGWGEFDAPNIPSIGSGDFMWEVKNIFGIPQGVSNKAAGVYGYKDQVTDNYRLIDLDVDLNMEDYDVITIVGYPTNEYMWDKFFAPMDEANAEPMIPVRAQLERLMGQVKQQVISKRKGLYINDPFSAIALGLIDRVEFVPTFKEHVVLDTRLGAATGYMDWHAAATDPFYGARPDVPLWDRVDMSGAGGFEAAEKHASRYLDLHANVKQRVRTVIEGLTTAQSYIKTDHIVWQNLNPMNEPPYQESIAYTFKPRGLDIGDEFYMEGGYQQLASPRLPLPIAETRHLGWLATPVRNIKVGTAVTTFANGFYATKGDPSFDNAADSIEIFPDEYIGNPYYQHAVSIAVQPGDLWDGQTVAGKVYINFTEMGTHRPEGWNKSMIMARAGVDDVEGALGIGGVFKYKDGSSWTVKPEHIRYQFSTHYGEWGGGTVNLPDTRGSGPDWGWSSGGTRGSGSGVSAGGGEAMNWGWEPIIPMVEIETPSMANRAVKWLASDSDISGNANVNVQTLQVTAEADEIEVEAERNTFVDLSTARVNTESYNDKDTTDPDVSVMVGTASALARAHETVMEINVSTARAVARAAEVEYEAVEIDWSEALIMTLPRQLLTLILEDND